MGGAVTFRDSDGSEVRLELVELTPELVGTYVEAKGLNATCERCGEREWEIALDGAPNLGNLVVSDPAARSTAGHLPVYVILCRHCGNLWLVSARAFLQWHADRAPEGQGNG